MGKYARFATRWAKSRKPVAPALTISLSPAQANINAGSGATLLTATVENTTKAVIWTMSGVGALAVSTVGQKLTAEYTPPATVAESSIVAVVATIEGTQISSHAKFTVAPAGAVLDPVDPNLVIISRSLRAITGSALETYLGAADSELRVWRDRAINGYATKPSWAYMTSAQRDSYNVQVADTLPYDTKYIDAPDGEGKYWVTKIHTDPDGTSYVYRAPGPGLPSNGANSICRDISAKALGGVGLAFRGTQEIRYLSLVCMDLRHARSIMKVGSSLKHGDANPDGYAGWGYGTNGLKHILPAFTFDSNGPLYDNKGRGFNKPTKGVATIETRDDRKVPKRWSAKPSLTYQNQWAGNSFLRGPAGNDVGLEYAIAMALVCAGLGAHQNRDRYCPINEAGKTTSPTYFASAAVDALYMWDQIGKKFGVRNAGTVRETLPLPQSEDIFHGCLTEICGAVAVAKILAGSAWRTHDLYLRAVRAWKMTCAPWNRRGVSWEGRTPLPDNWCSHWEYNHPTYGPMYFWRHQMPRMNPKQTKVNGEYERDWTGEIVPASPSSGNGPHLSTYTRMTYAAWAFLYLEGCGKEMTGLNADFMTKCARAVVASMKARAFPNDNMPTFTDGNGAFPTPTGFSKGAASTSVTVDKGGMALTSYLALLPWDDTGQLKIYADNFYKNNGGHKGYGAIGASALGAAIALGKIVPHADN